MVQLKGATHSAGSACIVLDTCVHFPTDPVEGMFAPGYLLLRLMMRQTLSSNILRLLLLQSRGAGQPVSEVSSLNKCTFICSFELPVYLCYSFVPTVEVARNVVESTNI